MTPRSALNTIFRSSGSRLLFLAAKDESKINGVNFRLVSLTGLVNSHGNSFASKVWACLFVFAADVGRC